MQDYTLRGTPVAQCTTHELQECLDRGIEIKDGPNTASALTSIMKRIDLELFIRSRNIKPATGV